MMPKAKPYLVGAVALAAFALGSQESSAQARGAAPARQAPAFEVDPLWPKPMPNHWLLGSAVGLAVDARDHIFVLHLVDSFNARTEIGAAASPPTGDCCLPAPHVLEFDPEGNLVGSWKGPGQGYVWPLSNHGLSIDAQGNIWIAGAGPTDTQLLKFSRDGKFIAQMGKPGAATVASTPAPADTAYAGVGAGRAGGRGGRGGGRGAGPAPLPPNSTSRESFAGPAEIAFDAASNEGFVADGFRNRRVAVIDLNTGAVKRFWGAYGNAPDDANTPPYNPDAALPRQFGTPVRCAELSRDGLVYVCDRSNSRIQVFRKDGTFVKEGRVAPKTRGAGAVWDVAFSRDPEQRYLYVADGMNMRVHILDRESLEVLTSFGAGGKQPGQFLGVHSIATDSKGNLYTVETNEGKRLQKFIFKGVQPVRTANSGTVWPGAR